MFFFLINIENWYFLKNPVERYLWMSHNLFDQLYADKKLFIFLSFLPLFIIIFLFLFFLIILFVIKLIGKFHWTSWINLILQ